MSSLASPGMPEYAYVPSRGLALSSDAYVCNSLANRSAHKYARNWSRFWSELLTAEHLIRISALTFVHNIFQLVTRPPRHCVYMCPTNNWAVANRYSQNGSVSKIRLWALSDGILRGCYTCSGLFQEFMVEELFKVSDRGFFAFIPFYGCFSFMGRCCDKQWEESIDKIQGEIMVFVWSEVKCCPCFLLHLQLLKI